MRVLEVRRLAGICAETDVLSDFEDSAIAHSNVILNP